MFFCRETSVPLPSVVVLCSVCVVASVVASVFPWGAGASSVWGVGVSVVCMFVCLYVCMFVYGLCLSVFVVCFCLCVCVFVCCLLCVFVVCCLFNSLIENSCSTAALAVSAPGAFPSRVGTKDGSQGSPSHP